MVTFNLDVEWYSDVGENLSLECDVDYLRGLRVDHTSLLVSRVNSDPLRLVILGNNLILSLEDVIVNDLNAPCLRMSEEALVVLKEIGGKHSNLGHQAFSLNGNSEHILSDTLKVDDKNHVVGLWEARNELNGYLCFLVLL